MKRISLVFSFFCLFTVLIANPIPHATIEFRSGNFSLNDLKRQIQAETSYQMNILPADPKRKRINLTGRLSLKEVSEVVRQYFRENYQQELEVSFQNGALVFALSKNQPTNLEKRSFEPRTPKQELDVEIIPKSSPKPLLLHEPAKNTIDEKIFFKGGTYYFEYLWKKVQEDKKIYVQIETKDPKKGAIEIKEGFITILELIEKSKAYYKKHYQSELSAEVEGKRILLKETRFFQMKKGLHSVEVLSKNSVQITDKSLYAFELHLKTPNTFPDQKKVLHRNKLSTKSYATLKSDKSSFYHFWSELLNRQTLNVKIESNSIEERTLPIDALMILNELIHVSIENKKDLSSFIKKGFSKVEMSKLKNTNLKKLLSTNSSIKSMGKLWLTIIDNHEGLGEGKESISKDKVREWYIEELISQTLDWYNKKQKAKLTVKMGKKNIVFAIDLKNE